MIPFASPQLIRRNDELALLYEKIKIQQSTLTKGHIQYRDRLNEIRVLKIKLQDLKRELGILLHSVQNIDVLKREVHHLGRELLQERTKVRILSAPGHAFPFSCILSFPKFKWKLLRNRMKV